METLKNPARRLPDLELPMVGGDPRRIRGGRRRAPILLLQDDATCPVCRVYAELLSERAPEIGEWDGEPMIVVPEESGRSGTTPDPSPPGRPADGFPFPVLIDAGGHLREALSLTRPALIVADQWGVIRLEEEGGPGHQLSPPEEVVAWARYLATECPECEGEAF